MPKTYARFASSPIGSGLAAFNDGLNVATVGNIANLARTTRSAVVQSSGTRGVEFAFTGDAQMLAAIGVVTQSASLGVMVGGDAQGICWRIDNGTVFSGNTQLASGLPAVAKGEIVGIRVRLADNAIDFYKGAAVVHSRALPVSGASWYFAVSMGAATAGDITASVNAGQWLPAGAAAQAGWPVALAAPATMRLSDLDYLAASTDAVPHARYEGIVESADFVTRSSMHFWAWDTEPPTEGSKGRVRVLDADGLLDGLAQSGIAGTPVKVRLGSSTGSVAAAAPLGRFRCDAIDVESDLYKVIQLANPHGDLDDSLHRVVYPISVPSLALRSVPVVIGAVASVPVQPVTSDGSVGWVADRRVYVQTVYDRGDPLAAVDWSMDPSGQQILFKSPPLGPVTCDCSSIGAGMQPATLQQALADIFGRIGKSAWYSADAAGIDAATGYGGVGYYTANGTARQAMIAVLASYGAWFYDGDDGALRFTRLIDPATVPDNALAFDLTDEGLMSSLQRTPDNAGLLARRMAYRPNAYVHSASDLVTDMVDLPPARRVELMSLTRGQVYAGGALSARYAHADTNPPFVSCLWSQQNAQSEANRILALYAADRFRYGWTEQDMALAPKPGQVGRITASRYGLSGGRKVVVVDTVRNPATGKVAMVLWG